MNQLSAFLKKKSQPIISITALVLAVIAMITIPLLSPVLARYTATSTVTASARVARFDVITNPHTYIGNGTWSAEPNIIQLATASAAVDATFELPLFDFEYATGRTTTGVPTVIGSNFVEHVFRPRAPFGHGNAATHTLENAPAGYYAFMIRGGDGGVGRTLAGVVGGYGGAGGMVMGTFRLNAPQTLYIEVGSAGAGGVANTQENRAHFGGGGNSNSGGQGGGATIISTASLRGASINPANIIAVAGGGGGGGGGNVNAPAPGGFHANNRGGNAGGSGTGGGTHQNPILNGAFVQAGGAVSVTGGFAIGGFRSGNPASANINRDITSAAGTNSSHGGGAGSATAGGLQHALGTGTAGTPLLGGNASAHGGGGGAGWFGGGGGHNNGAWHGGGGGGSSFVRSDVQPLSSEMIISDYFTDLVALQAYALSNARYAQGAPPRVVEREMTRSIALQDSSIIQDYASAGWNGFAYLVYMGPVYPNNSPALVVAPGTGVFGPPRNNPNLLSETAAGTDMYTFLDFHNRSDVAVRIRIEYDPVNSRMPNVDSNGIVTMGDGTNPNFRPPIMIRPFLTQIATGTFMISETTARRNLFVNRDGGRIAFGAATTDHRTGRNFNMWNTAMCDEGWFTLLPGQATGHPGRNTTDLPTIGIGWAWMYGVNTAHYGTFTAGGILFGATAPGGAWLTNNGIMGWNGLPASAPINNPALIPHIRGTGRGDNADRFDTILGREAARRRQNGLPALEMSLAFRITVEQVD